MALQTLRKGAASLVAKALLGLLIVSFAVWGIGDIFRGFGQQDVATIGNTKISVVTFRDLYNQRLQAFGRRLGRPVTPDQARALGLERQLLGELIAEAALDDRAKQLRLGVSNREVIRRIEESPAFRGLGNAFDRNQFDNVLRSNNFTEAGYVDVERRLAKRQQIAHAVSGQAAVPAVVLDALRRFENEVRSVEAVTVPREAAGEIPSPAEDELARFFEDRKVSFRAPEFRRVDVLQLTPDRLAAWIEVPDADIRTFYETNRPRFGSVERRAVQQIVFPTVEDARTAAARIAAGTAFEAVAAERNLAPKDIDLGIVTRADLLDPAVAAAAFGLAEGAVSEPVAGRFGGVLVMVTKIEPERLRPFEEVADSIRREIAADRARSDLLDRHDKVEDERAAGHTLKEVAEKLSLQLDTIEAVDRSGRDTDGSQIADFPGRADVIQGAFQTDIRTENDPIQLGANGFVWYEVTDIARARDRTLSEVKERVEQRWRDERIAERIQAKADDIRKRAAGGESLSAIAQSVGLTADTVTDVRRGRAGESLGEAVVARVFETPANGVDVALAEDGVSRVVFRVSGVAIDSGATASPRIADELKRALEDDLLAQYVTRLQQDLGVSINDNALRLIVGGESG